MRLSEYFKLNKTQFELDFIDIPLNTDIPLFVDPYAISTRIDLFSMECAQIIINFFQSVIDDIKNNNDNNAKYKLNYLNELNDTHLGLSHNKPRGKGVSGEQSIELFEALKKSKAAISGLLNDLSDCELLIPGISRDKISDITTNIIKTKLIEYTQQQCITYNIQTYKVSSGKLWNPVDGKWESGRYVDLPIYKNTRIILIPKVLVRYSLVYNHKKYYNNFVLEYLQEENISTNTSLVRLLKNGKSVVYKKDLKADDRYKLTKEFLFNFSLEHPDILENYTKSLPNNLPPLSNEDIEKKQTESKSFDYDSLINKLKSISPGTKTATEYHNLMVGILEIIFYPNLIIPIKQEFIHNGRKIIDITYTNAAKNGFFEYLAKHIACLFVICECKNYKDDPTNPELDQLSGRFSPNRGKFGILLCRTIENKDLFFKRCQDTANDDRGFIIPLDDDDIIKLLEYRSINDIIAIDDFFTLKYKKLVM
ncbi:MAG: hypothetical protein HYW86_04235 [Candidatus Roizmanbacteria bacterium]|nr:MAG: hypothetical protein HYW86_04235 [Candidatus Roizmanbacteria bacterium]